MPTKGSKLSKEERARRGLARLLHSEKEVVALNEPAHLMMLALTIRLGSKDLSRPLAKIVKGY